MSHDCVVNTLQVHVCVWRAESQRLDLISMMALLTFERGYLSSWPVVVSTDSTTPLTELMTWRVVYTLDNGTVQRRGLRWECRHIIFMSVLWFSFTAFRHHYCEGHQGISQFFFFVSSTWPAQIRSMTQFTGEVISSQKNVWFWSYLGYDIYTFI